MLRLGTALALVVLCVTGLAADPASDASSSDGWSSVVEDLQSVAADLADNQKQIDDLQAKITELQTLGKDSASQIARLQDLVNVHAVRVKELGERYTKVLVLAQKLKQDVERSALLNYVFGGTAIVALAVAVGEGFALAHR